MTRSPFDADDDDDDNDNDASGDGGSLECRNATDPLLGESVQFYTRGKFASFGVCGKKFQRGEV